jgi:hypothetical protein
VSYANMPTFEGTSIGIRRLSTLGNAGLMLGGLGDTQGDAAAAVGAGIIDQGTANFLISAGATDQDFINLLNGATDVPTLMVKYTTGNAAGSAISVAPGVPPLTPVAPGAPGTAAATGINPTVAPPPPSSSVQTALTTQPATPSPATAPQSPPGSTLLYTATFNPVPAFITASAVISAISAQLPTYRMAVVSSNVLSSGISGNASFTLTIMDSVGHSYLTDIQAVLDSLLQAATKNGKISSTTPVLIATGATVPTVIPSAATASSFVTSYWPLLLAGGFAALLIGIIVEKRT